MSAAVDLARLALAPLTPAERSALLRESLPGTRRRLGTRREAAEILAIHPGSVQRYERRGVLEAIRISPRRIRFDLDAVSRLAEFGTAGEVRCDR